MKNLDICYRDNMLKTTYRVTSVETITPTILLFLDSSWAMTETLSTKNSSYLFCNELGKPLG